MRGIHVVAPASASDAPAVPGRRRLTQRRAAWWRVVVRRALFVAASVATPHCLKSFERVEPFAFGFKGAERHAAGPALEHLLVASLHTPSDLEHAGISLLFY